MIKLVLCFFVVIGKFGQVNANVSKKETTNFDDGRFDDKIYSIKEVDILPQPNEGIDEFKKNIKNKFEILDVDNKKIFGKIIISFVVELDGSLGKTNIIKDFGFASGNEMLYLLFHSTKWKPAKLKGKNIRCNYVFEIDTDEK